MAGGGKRKRSTNVATKRKRSLAAKKGWETRRAREQAEAEAKAKRTAAAKKRRAAERARERQRQRILEEARAAVERLKRRVASAVEVAKENTAELRAGRDRNVPMKERRELQDLAVEASERAYEESRELNAAMRVLAKLEGEPPPRRRSVTRARQSVEDALQSMMVLASQVSDGPAWARMRVLWYEARSRLFGATGKNYEQYLDVMYRIAEATETDWQIAYGP